MHMELKEKPLRLTVYLPEKARADLLRIAVSITAGGPSNAKC